MRQQGWEGGDAATLSWVTESRNLVTSVRQAAAACNVTPPVVRRWRSLGLISAPPWTLKQLRQIRDQTDPQGRRRGPRPATHIDPVGRGLRLRPVPASAE